VSQTDAVTRSAAVADRRGYRHRPGPAIGLEIGAEMTAARDLVFRLTACFYFRKAGWDRIAGRNNASFVRVADYTLKAPRPYQRVGRYGSI